MINQKLYSDNDLSKFLKKIRKKDFNVGFANGCFDLLHNGHLSLIYKAKRMCDYLIVGINSDESIKSLKGENRPIQNELTRITNLSKLKDVDAIVIFKDITPIKIINKIVPDLLFKGSDYKGKEVVGSNIVKKNGGKVVLIDILEGYSTSKIVNETII